MTHAVLFRPPGFVADEPKRNSGGNLTPHLFRIQRFSKQLEYKKGAGFNARAKLRSLTVA